MCDTCLLDDLRQIGAEVEPENQEVLFIYESCLPFYSYYSGLFSLM